MARPFFADTAYWAALANPRDSLAGAAVGWYEFLEASAGAIVTTDWVLAETVALVEARAPTQRIALLNLVEDIRTDQAVTTVHVTRRTRDAAWQQLAGRPERHWSWTDAVSFVVMRERRLTAALTVDAHFREAGFLLALPLDPASFA